MRIPARKASWLLGRLGGLSCRRSAVKAREKGPTYVTAFSFQKFQTCSSVTLTIRTPRTKPEH